MVDVSDESMTVRAMLTTVTLVLVGCGVQVRANDVVMTDALRKTDCATLVIDNTPDGRYLAHGCGKRLLYACERDSGFAMTKPGAIDNVGCREVK